jgi:hypothetical protein
VRVFHDVDVDTATEIVDALVERETPLIWEVNGSKRVLDTSLKMKPKTLLLLYASNGSVSDRDLVSWLEHSNATVYKQDVLRPMHKERLIEYDKVAGTVTLSPLGVAEVEDKLLRNVA